MKARIAATIVALFAIGGLAFAAGSATGSAEAGAAATAADRDRPNGLALGFSVGDRHGDFSLGAEAMSPWFFNDIFALKAGAELLWKEGRPTGAAASTWTPYYLARLGLLAGSASDATTRLYGEFGGLVLVPTAGLSAATEPRAGIYGNFGLEFALAPASHGAYFLELGSTGTFGAAADKLQAAPLIANGFAVRAGFRWRF
jgi:hypothetical protein